MPSKLWVLAFRAISFCFISTCPGGLPDLGQKIQNQAQNEEMQPVQNYFYLAWWVSYKQKEELCVIAFPSEAHKTGFVPLKQPNPSVPPPTPSCVEGASPRAADTLSVLCQPCMFLLRGCGMKKRLWVSSADLCCTF